MKIGIDFDRVLFDTDSFNTYYKESTGLKHVESDVYDENNNYDPEKHAEICEIPKKNIWSALENLERFLYDDISKLEKIDEHEIIIVTRGNEKFQKEKIKSSNVEKYVDGFEIIENGSKDQADIDVLADDTEEELKKADISGIKINRPNDGIKKIIEVVKDFES